MGGLQREALRRRGNVADYAVEVINVSKLTASFSTRVSRRRIVSNMGSLTLA